MYSTATSIAQTIGRRLFGPFVVMLILGLGSVLSQAQSSDGWKQRYDASGVTLWYQVQSCNGSNYILIKAENTSSHSATLNWDFSITAGDRTYDSQLSKSSRRTLTLAAGARLQGDCVAIAPGTRSLRLPLEMYITGVTDLSTVEFNVVNVTLTQE